MALNASADFEASVLATARGRMAITLLCATAFVVFIDTTIINVALPSIRRDLGFSVQDLQWAVSAYLLANGGFLLLGGRLADLAGRRRILIWGSVLLAGASLVGGLANSEIALVGSRFFQGFGAALMAPAALSLLTTTFTTPRDRIQAIGLWAGTIPVASALGVLLGGLLSQGPGWRWVFLFNVPICGVLVFLAWRSLAAEGKRPRQSSFDVVGTLLSAAGMLSLVYGLVNAPEKGWTDARTLGGLALAAILLTTFILRELRVKDPLVPLSIFGIGNVGVADGVWVIAQAGFVSMFFFMTLYMQNVLGYRPVVAGAAYIPVTACVAFATFAATRLTPRIGVRWMTVIGALLGAAGVFWLSRITTDGTYLESILPGFIVMALGLGSVFVSLQAAANEGVPPERAGLAGALITASSTLGGALGLAVFSAIAAERTSNLIAAHQGGPSALTGGFQLALAASAGTLVVAAAIAAVATRPSPSFSALRDGEPAAQTT
jgi:EmrB/QacA subfamily drug resistance transporter